MAVDMATKLLQHHMFENFARRSGGLTARQLEAKETLLENAENPDFKDAVLVDMGNLDALGDRYIHAWIVWKVIDSIREQKNLSPVPVRAVHRGADALLSKDWFQAKLFDVMSLNLGDAARPILERGFRAVAERLGVEPNPQWWSEPPKLFPLIGSEAFAGLDLAEAVRDAQTFRDRQEPDQLRICIGQAGSNEVKRMSDTDVQELIYQQRHQYPNAQIVLVRDSEAWKSEFKFRGLDEVIPAFDLTRVATQVLAADAFRLTDTAWTWIAGGSVGRLSVLYTVAGPMWRVPGADATFGSLAQEIPDTRVLKKDEYRDAHPYMSYVGISPGDFQLFLDNLEHEEPLQKDTRSPEDRLAI